MASLLYRLGLGAARRPIAIVIAWLLVLAAVTAAMVSFQRPLTNEFELPDSEFAAVLDELGEQIPEVAGGTGTVVLHSEDGFTPAQRRVIDETMAQWRTLPHVTGTVDPFETQRQLDQSSADLAEGEQKLIDGRKKYEKGARKLSRLRWLVGEGERDIARLQRTDPDNATLPYRISGQAELDAMLADGERKLDRARTRLERGQDKYTDGATLRGLGDGVRMVSEDGTTALVQVRFDESMQQISPDDLALVPQAGEQLEDAGVEVDYGQELVFVTQVGGIGEIIGVAVAAVVLLVMLGSFVMAGLPLAIAFAGVGASLMGAMALTHWLDIQQMAPVLGAMLGLAVGIDYALFIVNRHRRQLADVVRGGAVTTREEIRHSIALATGTAGTAVVVAGATVIIALAALLVSGIPTLIQMGLLAAATVTVTVLVALTLTPALLSLAGRRAVPRKAVASTAPHRDGWPEKWVGVVTRRAPAAIVAVVIVMGALAVPALSLRLGLPDGGSESRDSTAFQAYERVADAFGTGANGPILVSATLETPIAAGELVGTEARIGEEIAAVEGVRDVLPIGVSEDRRTVAFQVVSEEGPSAERTVALVDALRGPVTESLAGEGVDLGVTGQAVANIEVSERLAGALPLYIALVIGLSLVLLTIVFRSVLVPILATAGFLLSVVASFGVIVAVYQWGWLGGVFDVHNPGAVFSFMPTLLIGILFGLAMDYQMFLVSGMRESYVHGQTAGQAVRNGFASGARVVAAAALIMVAVFSGFVFSHMTMARPIGLGLAVGVLLDAFLIRMTLTPAVMSLLGDKIWWMPVWLDRLLPHLDVEGSALVDKQRPPRRSASREDVLV
ncbi:MMPL domain-containing protein [Nocardioides sp. CF8]|uniref:MMPL family transporter n=1 Tax=Nocardioides sp. CF8 TaxID=110319 RepID=UPI00032F0E39|nr:MMPL family transporter [Nocardioides sp. CF8]EON24430.1 MMPL domain-containing protein [Nocardioides sp. CF8]